ncbi:hypothetical protein TruAng_008881 [Truncatella angustata]|nr:hypothetical protein TruAng_008881 [Truncatella angustata]
MQSLVSFVAVAALLCGFSTAQNCRCAPTDPCWPAAPEWDSLNATVAGRLIKSVPPGAVCYRARPEYNETACQAVIAGWSTSVWHSSNPVSIPAPAMANDSCNPIYPNGTSVTGDVYAGDRGCDIGLYPPYVVNATEVAHIKAALKFVKKWNLRLNIKNTGHNGAGRNIGYGSLSIWTHNLKKIEFNEKFSLSGNCSLSANATQLMAITVGAGVQDGELYTAAAKDNVVTVGGTSMDVGVVGWATGGGHGTLTGQYGQGADNIIEATLVTADGDLLTANQCQNADIFWAIRGGGGGTFGVITSVTMKAYTMPSVNLMGLNISAKNGTTSKQWFKLVADIHKLMPAAQDAGLSGYWTMGGDPTWSIAFSMFQYNKDNTTAEKVQQPFIDLLHASNATVTYSITKFNSPSWFQLMSLLPVAESAGTLKEITASRFITRKTVLENQDAFIQTLEAVGPKNPGTLDGKPNFSMSGTMTASKIPVDNALNPAWRDAAVHVITSRKWNDAVDRAQAAELVYDMTYNKLNLLRQLEPASGCYLNEANTMEPGWQWSFFGSNYGRLRQIKDKYDPTGVFWCPQCVGSENWVQTRDGLLCEGYNPLAAGK